jgi:PKD repeat protein
MLNKSYDIKAKDFTTETVSNVVDTWYVTAIPYADFAKSMDRASYLFTGKQMTVYAWIVFDGNTIKQDPTHLLTNTVEIPTDLLVPNVAPTASLAGPTTGFVGEALEFNASASTDDMGFDGLSFKWDWGDGHTSTFLVEEVEMHTYNAAGSYTVIVNATDEEDAWDNATLTVTITEPLTITVGSMDVMTDPGEHFNDTYVTFTIVNAAMFAVDISGLDPALVNGTGDGVEHNGTADTVPGEIDAEGSLTVTVYFVVPEDFTPVEIMLLGETYALP